MNAIDVSHLTCTYGTFTAVDDISFSVQKGSFFGFLGPNGAGKTTTIRSLTGVMRPYTGTIQIGGTDILKDPLGAKMKIGVIPENSTVYGDLSAEQNMHLTGKFYGLPYEVREKNTTEILTKLGLLERRTELVRRFSKGLRQRVSIACAIIHKPEILIVDEPTSGLDVQSRRLVIETLRQMSREGTTIFVTTHNIEEANDLCDTVCIINKGRIIATGSPTELKQMFDTTRSVTVTFDQEVPSSFLRNEAVARALRTGEGWRLYTDNPDAVVKFLTTIAEEHDYRIQAIATSGPSLEEVFVRLTEERCS